MARFLSLAGLFLVFALCAVWGALALWYQAPLGPSLRIVPPVFWTLTFLIGFSQGVATGFRAPILNGAILMTGLLMWWSTIKPSNDRDWAPEVSRIASGSISGNTLTIHDARNFNWRSQKDFDPAWETRTYDLDKLASLDLVASYWSGETIAHVLLSFGFADGRYLLWSTEVRRTPSQQYSTISGFFKQSELAILAGDERDFLRLRTSVRNPQEDVRIFRINMPKDKVRELLVAYVEEANDLKATPRWYNTATTNCTTVVFRLARLVEGGIPFDWRVLASGYFPNYIYDRGAMTPGVPFAELRDKGKSSARGRAADALPSEAFSAALRVGVPGVPTVAAAPAIVPPPIPAAPIPAPAVPVTARP